MVILEIAQGAARRRYAKTDRRLAIFAIAQRRHRMQNPPTSNPAVFFAEAA
jgi:hypothetical protein